MMVDEQPRPPAEPTPPLADLSTRPSPVPGPLTKPAPVIRAQKRKRRRWLILGAVLIVLAGLIAGGIAWSNSLQAAPQSEHSSSALRGEHAVLLAV
ncbi:hypothetical protein [Microbacterium sp. AK031]|uniref:hypothetical protein n=1 Tax=Microbacterium sp. AK031 TaxID=2723076 RepID=UPI00216A5C1A|nr:hypothetical protein [Microbacterium sp. AK031]MCS3843143.1 hypothetical protein [Microbacterium sp. AK031]